MERLPHLWTYSSGKLRRYVLLNAFPLGLQA